MLLEGTFLVLASEIILIIGVVCGTLHFISRKIILCGPITRQNKYDLWYTSILFPQFNSIDSQKREDPRVVLVKLNVIC